MDDSQIWLVPEDEEEKQKFQVIVNKLTEKQVKNTEYQTVKQLLKMDYILLGKDQFDVTGISGVVIFNQRILKDNNFHTEVIIKNYCFKPFFKYLIKDMKLKRFSDIKFIFQRERPVIVVINNEKVGVIAPFMGEIE